MQLDARDYTDIHIHTRGPVTHDGERLRAMVDVDGSLLYPGARSASSEHAPLLYDLVAAARAHKKADFMVEVRKIFFRVRRDDYAVDGTWYRYRRMADTAPELDTLRLKLPQPMRQALLDPSLLQGGLVLVVGGPGCGKTTTASATVVSRLKAHAGVAFTVEDPAEMPLNGRHGQGYCTQSEVAGDTGREWVESMRGILRSQPVGTPLMLYVGEIRDADAARVMLRAASNGFLVICTAFGADIITGLDSLFQLVGERYAVTLAQVLRVVLHQNLRDDRLTAEILCSAGSSSRVAATLRGGPAQLPQLRNEIQVQRNAMILQGGAPCEAAASPLISPAAVARP